MNSKHFHEESLLKLCRICGYFVGKKVYSVDKHTENIKKVFYLNTLNDSKLIHPPNFCAKCYVTISNAINRGSTTNRTPFSNW